MDTQTEDAVEDGNMQRKSIVTPGSPLNGAGSNRVGGNTRRYSIGITSSRKGNQEEGKTVPNYLRASTGSCHDFCKYGKKHEQSKSASPIKFKRAAVVNKEKVTKTVVPVEIKKTKMVTKLKPSPDPKTRTPTELIEVIKRDVSLPSQKVEVSKRGFSNVKPNPVIMNPSSSSGADSLTGSNGGTKKKDVRTIRKTAMTPKSASVNKVIANDTPTESQSQSKPSVGRFVSLKARKHKNVKLVSPLKDQNRMQKIDQLQEPITDKIQIKTLHVLETESEVTPESLEFESVPATFEIIQYSPPRSVESTNPPVSDRSQSSYDKEVLEFESTTPTHVLKTSQDFVSESSQSCYDEEVIEEEFEYIDDEALEESEYEDELETSVGNHDKIPRKGRMVISEKDDEAVKLRFRRGKILDAQFENNGPRRLNFRKGRIIEGKEHGQRVARRTFEKKDFEQEHNDSNRGPESVVLKHQGEQGKKDAQGLFNNVIEETASKLVESRKSKVKALVGAFETVISLQDGKLKPGSCDGD